MKQRLIILSDLWGKEKSQWVTIYIQQLNEVFEVQYYDSCELGDIDKSNYNQESLHHQFVDGGIETAVDKLISLETQRIHVLAFSVGGVIAWKFGLITQFLKSLYCVSSTRLRHEKSKPKGHIELFFGEEDRFKPSDEWFSQLELHANIVRGAEHMIYTIPEFGSDLVSKISKNLK